MDSILYHYTGYVALDGILRSSELRLNNVLNMNDAEEMRLFMNGVCRCVTDRLRAEGMPRLAEEAEQLFATELQREFRYSAYAACFSHRKDDAAQWERYGRAGRGVCIGFSREALKKLTTGALSLEQVYYQSDMSGHPLIDTFVRAMQLPEPRRRLVLRRALDEAWTSSAAFKHPSFFSEDEVRLVVTPFQIAYFQVQPQYHVTEDRIKKFYPLNLRELCGEAGISLEELIVEIVIGPQSTQSPPIMRDYLQSLQLPILAEHVTVSECPLRSVVR